MNLTPVLSANKAGSLPTATEKVSDSYAINLMPLVLDDRIGPVPTAPREVSDSYAINLMPLVLDDRIGPVPTAKREILDSYETNLPQSDNSVNTNYTQNNENYSQGEENQRSAQENPPIIGFYAYVKNLQLLFLFFLAAYYCLNHAEQIFCHRADIECF